jgi:transposase InsO family protein
MWFCAEVPDQIWVADITYVSTGEGWLRLAAVMDLHSRAVVGWAMAPQLRTSLVIDGLEMGIARRRPAEGSCTTPTKASGVRWDKCRLRSM